MATCPWAKGKNLRAKCMSSWDQDFIANGSFMNPSSYISSQCPHPTQLACLNPNATTSVRPHLISPDQEWSSQGFPGGAVVESLPANAGDMGSSPGLGRSHMPWSGWAREPQLLSLRVWSLCSATREAATVRGPCTAMKSGPPLAGTGESPHTEMKTQHSQK